MCYYFCLDDLSRTFAEVDSRVVITLPMFLPKIREALAGKDTKVSSTPVLTKRFIFITDCE